jgi:hypothetical protein
MSWQREVTYQELARGERRACLVYAEDSGSHTGPSFVLAEPCEPLPHWAGGLPWPGEDAPHPELGRSEPSEVS